MAVLIRGLGRVAALAAIAVVLVSPGATAAPCPNRSQWPTEEWPSRIDQLSATRADAIAAMEDYAFRLEGRDEERKGLRTEAVLVVHRGDVVYERYARGWDASKRHLLWSVSKSVTSALVGIAVSRGAFTLDDSVCDRLDWAPDDRCDLRVRHLLEFSSGLDWKEVYEGESNQVSSVLAMLYGEGRRDMARFVLGHAYRDPPGESWMYSTGDTTLLMSVVQAALAPEAGDRFPWTLLFDRIGITSATWERDPAGTMVGGSYLYLTPRDMARFGFLYLNDGCWGGERILPENWVAESLVPAETLWKKAIGRGPTSVNGRSWWLNVPLPGVDTERPYPDVPEDAYFATGHWGQSITVIPSLDLVIVRVADDRDGSFDRNQFTSLVTRLVQP